MSKAFSRITAPKIDRRVQRHRRVRKLLVLAVVGLLFSWTPHNRAQAAAGDLDPTFGGGGLVTTSFFNGECAVAALALQPDGRLIAAGRTGIYPGVQFALVRYNANGSLDAGFGAGGRVTTDFFGEPDAANAVTVQSNGKIIAAGLAFNPGASSHNSALARYDTNGILDSTFGVGGRVTTSFPGGSSVIQAIVLQPNGKILAAGISLSSGPGDFALARYNADGTLDASFGSGGLVVTDFSGGVDHAFAIALQSNGKVVAAGRANTDFALARYDTNGNLDATFGSGGKVTGNFAGATSAVANGVVLKPDGKIIAAGYVTFSSTNSDFALMRFDGDGHLDPTFGSGGKVTTDFFGSLDYAFGIVRQFNGKLIVGGNAFGQTGVGFAHFTLAKYNDDGSLDATFGTGGKVTTIVGGLDSIRAMVLQPDGRLVAAGETIINPMGLLFALARYENVTSFDICLQDDVNGNLLQFNSSTGDYRFSNCRKGLSLSGVGSVSIRFCKIELRAAGADHSITAQVNSCTGNGSAFVQVFSPARTFSVFDSDITNNACACP